MLLNKLKQTLSGQFVRNVGWLGSAELLNRVFRLGTTVILTRLLSTNDYGLLAIIATTSEFANVFTLRGGIGSKLIQADESDVKVLAETAYWLNWIIFCSIFTIQCLASFPVAGFYGNNNVILPICVSALSYLVQPFFIVQSALIERENRLNVMAICNVTQSMISNVLTIGLALLGMGIWAVIISSLIAIPVWIVITYRNHSWRPKMSFTLERWQELANFGTSILGVDLLNKLRANADYLLVGRFLGVDALGLYYFAFNAGLGISLNIMGVFWVAMFPHLCAARNNFNQFKKRYFDGLKGMALVFVPLILLQAGAAPFYVPIVFGQKWIPAIPILVLVCLSALPRGFANVSYQLLQAVDKTTLAFYWDLIFTAIFMIALLVAVQWGIYWVAASVLITHVLALPLFTIWVTKYVFGKNSSFSIANEK